MVVYPNQLEKLVIKFIAISSLPFNGFFFEESLQRNW